MKKRAFAMLLAVIMLFSLMPTVALAVDEPKLIMYYMDWGSGTPTRSEWFTDFWDPHPYGANDLYPALMIGDQVQFLDPADLYSSDENALSVSPSTEFEGTVRIQSLSTSDAYVLYDHSDGNTYRFPINVTLPSIGFYTKPEAAAEHYIGSFSAREGNDKVYLVAQDGYTFRDLSLENFPAGTTFEISADNTMATVTIGRAAVMNAYVGAGVTVVDAEGNTWENRMDFKLTTNFPGIICRYPDWDENGNPFENPNTDPTASPRYTKGDQHTCYFYFYDGTTETRLSAAQLTSTDESVVIVSDEEVFKGAIRAVITGFGNADLVYTQNGKDYTFHINSTLPDFGFYTTPTPSEANFIDTTNGFSYTEDNNTIYLVLGDNMPDGIITNISLFDEYSAFPEGSSYTIAADGRSAAITIGTPLYRENWISLCADIAFPDWGGSDRVYPTVYVKNTSPGLFFYMGIYENDELTADDSYEHYDWYTRPSNCYLFPMLNSGTDIIPLDPAKLSSDNEAVAKISVAEANPAAARFEFHDFGSAIISYTHTDGKTYRFPVVIMQPDFAFYTIPSPDPDHYVYEFERTDENNVLYLVSAYGATITQLQLFSAPEGTTYEISEDGSLVTFVIGDGYVEEPRVLATFSGYDQFGYPFSDWDATFRLTGEGVAPDTEPADKCGENAIWTFDKATGTLTISGEGEMYGFDSGSAPWYLYRDEMKALVIEEGITDIGAHAFEDCKFTTATIPNSVTTLYGYAFANCVNLTSIDLPNVSKILSNAFDGCHSLQEINFMENGQLDIYQGAFRDCKSITTLYFPASLIHIEVKDTMLGMDSLTAIVVDPDNPYYSSDGNGALYNKHKTTLYKLPNAYSGSFTVPATTTFIWGYAFRECIKLTDVTFPEGLEYLEQQLLDGCTSLKQIVLPKSLTYISENVVSNCPALTDVYYNGTEEQWNKVEIAPNNEEFMALNFHFNGAVPTPTPEPTPEPTPTPEVTPAPAENPFTDVKETDWYLNPVMWAVENNITGGLTATSFGPNASCTRAQVVTFLYAAAGKPDVEVEDNPFTDVKESDWFYKPVMWAVQNGITGGLTATTFGPNNTCTRAQVVTFLYAAAGKPTPTSSDHPFTDVQSGDWYLNPVLWAVEKGVTGGLTANTFGPNNTCTRAQVVTFLYAYKTK